MNCEHCNREISETTGECRWSDCPGNRVTCPACGYVYSAYDSICSRCWGRDDNNEGDEEEVTRVEIEGSYDENYALIDGDRAEIFGQNYSDRKNREYSLHLVRVTTRDEAMSRSADKLAAERESKAAAAAANAAKQSRDERLAALAGDYDGLSLTAKGEVEDRYGNYLFSLPHEIPADIGRWIKAEMAAYLDGGE